MASSVTCPKCHAVIKTAGPVPAGKQVKCPKCSAPFVTPRTPVAAAKSSGSKPGAGSSSGSKPGVARNPGSRAGVVKKPAPTHQGFDFGSFENADSNSNGTTSDKPASRRKKRGSMVGCLMMCAFLVLLVGGAAVALGFGLQKAGVDVSGRLKKVGLNLDLFTRFWPGKGGGSAGATTDDGINNASGMEDPLAYLPADSTLVAGFDIGNIATQRPSLLPALEAIWKDNGSKMLADPQKDSGLEAKDLFDHVWVATTGRRDKPESITLILQSKSSFDAKKIKQSAPEASLQKLNNKSYYKIKDTVFTTLFMPTDRILVLTSLAEDKLPGVVGDGTGPVVPSDVLTLIKKVEKNSGWVVGPIDGAAKMEISLRAGAPSMPKAMNPSFTAALEAKAFGIWANIDGGGIRITAGLSCNNATDANTVQSNLQAQWTMFKTLGPTIKENLAKGGNPELKTLFEEVLTNLVVSKRETFAEASVQVSVGPLEKLVMDTQKNGPDLLKAEVEGIVSAGPAKPPDKPKVDPGKPAMPEDKPVVLSNEEKRLLDHVNKLRTDKQKPALKLSPKLFAVARAHAAAMAKKEKEEDEDDGKDTMARVKEAGYKWSKDLIAYNSAVGQNWNPDQCYQTWSQTLVPSENMKTETYLETGIGIAKSDSGNVFFYQIFAAPE